MFRRKYLSNSTYWNIALISTSKPMQLSTMAVKLFVLAILLGCQITLTVCSGCIPLSGLSGSIDIKFQNYDSSYCHVIKVPPQNYVTLNVYDITYSNDELSSICPYYSIAVEELPTNRKYDFCPLELRKNPATFLQNIRIQVKRKHQYSYNSYRNIQLRYIVKSLKCIDETSFSCDNHTCIDRSQVCDDVKDCQNEADEVKCETGVRSVENLDAARVALLSWLQKQRTMSNGWRENTARAIAALSLSGSFAFDGTHATEELIAKQAQLQTSLALLKPSVSSTELSLLIHSLLVTCHNPRSFYGNDLLKKLLQQVESNANVTHPLVYLSLCNARHPWPPKAVEDLSEILTDDPTHPFMRDIQAMAVMAVSCMKNSPQNTIAQNASLSLLAHEGISEFKSSQQTDGSFGSVYTTALVVQALMASGHERSKDWKLKESVHYLIRETNSSTVDFLATYLTLPILNGKTLADIYKTNCSQNPNKLANDPLTVFRQYRGSRAQVQYSLFVGDHMDIVHTLSFRVPTNYTAFQLMELAAAQDTKYKFEWKTTFHQKYVYEIAQITNDPEIGKFWLMYIDSKSKGSPEQVTKGPDGIVLENKDHVIMWYKTAHI